MRTMNGMKALGLACVVALGACDILDVDNPNNLTEADVQQPAASSAVVNGALSLVASSVSQIWEPYLVTADEFSWIGSRDAWFELDQGFHSNPNNEFTDGRFPSLGRGRWMSDEAIEIMEAHVAERPTDDNRFDLARAYFYSGIIYMVIGEVMDDFPITSDKRESGPPVGPDNMSSVLDQAATKLQTAIDGFRALGRGEWEMRATAVLARAKHSRAVWDKLNPSANTGDPLVSAGTTEAGAVITMAGGLTADWSWGFTYSSGTISNAMAGNINDRKENQWDVSLVSRTAANDRDEVVYMDPLDNIPDPVVIAKVEKWTGGAVSDNGGIYSPLDVVSTRMMHLILAEAELDAGREGGFVTHINHVRAMDGLSDYEGSGQMDPMAMLEHARRVNLLTMGLRLADMYRFGVNDPLWTNQSDAINNRGVMLPITIIEIRANCHLNGQGCD